MSDKSKERPTLTDDEIMDIYNEGPLYHVPMHEHDDETEREEERAALLMFARDIIAISMELSECEWTHNEDEGAWSTGCGSMFVFNDDGTPADHGMHYCYSCGSKIAKKETE